MTTIQPSLPLLYFASASERQFLPPELLQRCLTEYSDWGDLARLSCAQQAWSQLLQDAANQSAAATWSAAQACWEGTHGMARNERQAMNLLLSLTVGPTNEYSASAMKQLATLYFEGRGVDADASQGVAWLQRAHTDCADDEAAHDLALVYEHGKHGIEIDVVAAVEWFRKAAEHGHVEAMAELGLCYELGLAVEQSDEQALDWYMKAAEQGHLTAKYSVGEAFEEARGVPQSDAEACLWYYKAAIAGDEDSCKALRRLEDIARIVLPNVGVLLDA